MAKWRRIAYVFVLFSAFLATGTGDAQETSRCADCHFANPDAPGEFHLSHWDLSLHGRNHVGCEKCHGGDATTFESFLAHQGILNARNPASPIHHRNLPATCGGCHTGQFVAFQRSHHYDLLRDGDGSVPVCTTCHGEVAARLLSPKALEGRCAGCHGEGKIAPQPEFPVEARRFLEGIADVRELLDTAESLIRRVKDDSRRLLLRESLNQAQVPLQEAVSAGHSFVFDQLEERLGVARERVLRLLDELANPDRK